MGATYVREWLGFVVADHAQRRAQAADLVVPDHQGHAVAAVLFAIACPLGVLSEVHLRVTNPGTMSFVLGARDKT